MPEARTAVIIDCDPGIDDAIAILLALASTELRVLAITTVAGNNTVRQETENALRLLDLVGRSDVPVAAGANRALIAECVRRAPSWHGSDGLGGADLPAASRACEPDHAIDLIARQAEANRPITLIAIGPLTNMALLLARYPSIVDRIARLIIMGGASSSGNATPAAEFNIWVDPEAAHRVFSSGLDITMVPLDVTLQARLYPHHVDRIRTMGLAGATVARMLDYYAKGPGETYHSASVAIHDALAVAEAIQPKLLKKQHLHVAVDYASSISRGATIIDRWGYSGQPANVSVATSVDVDAFLNLLFTRFESLAQRLSGPRGG